MSPHRPHNIILNSVLLQFCDTLSPDISYLGISFHLFNGKSQHLYICSISTVISQQTECVVSMFSSLFLWKSSKLSPEVGAFLMSPSSMFVLTNFLLNPVRVTDLIQWLYYFSVKKMTLIWQHLWIYSIWCQGYDITLTHHTMSSVQGVFKLMPTTSNKYSYLKSTLLFWCAQNTLQLWALQLSIWLNIMGHYLFAGSEWAVCHSLPLLWAYGLIDSHAGC